MYSLRSPEEASGYINNCSQLDAQSTTFAQLFPPDASTDAAGS